METFLLEDLHLQGISIHLTNSHIGGNIKSGPSKTFEFPVREWIEKTLEPGWTYVDVGAHVGVFATYAMKLMSGDGEILCYEPREDIADILRGNLAIQPWECNYEVIRKAVWDSEGAITLFENRGTNDGDNRVVNTPERGAEGWAEVEVQATTLDAEFTRRLFHSKRPIFLKIDAQWAEMEVLRGSIGPFLNRVESGVVEVQLETRAEIIEFLVAQDFNWTDLGPDIGFHRQGS